jgi:hypothetical protein
MATQTMLVRLKPYNPKRGYLLRRFTYRGIRFQEERGWYRVDEEIAKYLSDVRQVDSDLDSSPAFDVCTEEEARALEEKERREKRQRARVGEAINVNETAAEPRSPRSSPAGDDEDLDEEDASEKPSPDLTTADLPQNKAPAKTGKPPRRK